MFFFSFLFLSFSTTNIDIVVFHSLLTQLRFLVRLGDYR